MQQSQERLDAASGQDVGDIAPPPPIPAREMAVPDPADAATLTAEPETGVGETTDLFQAESAQPISLRPTSTPPDKFQLETRVIELGAALIAMQQLFSHLERDFYLAAFGRYDE